MIANLPILYSFRRCPYAMRARLALAVSSQVCELREVSLKNKPAELLAAWPGATVPVLVLPPKAQGANVLVHSLEIMLWALAQADPEHWLQPANGSPAQMLALVAKFDTQFKPLLDRTKYPSRYASEWAAFGATSAALFAAWNRQQGTVLLMALEHLLRQQALRAAVPGTKPWLYGPQPSLADMAVLPFVRQLAAVDRHWFDSQPGWPCLAQWLADWEGSALFAATMEKYPPWQPGTRGIAFP